MVASPTTGSQNWGGLPGRMGGHPGKMQETLRHLQEIARANLRTGNASRREATRQLLTEIALAIPKFDDPYHDRTDAERHLVRIVILADIAGLIK